MNHGFTFKNTVNDQPLRLWLRVEPEGQPDMDADDIEALFEQYGFEVRMRTRTRTRSQLTRVRSDR